MSNFLDIDFVIKLNAKRSRRFDLSEGHFCLFYYCNIFMLILIFYSHLKMTSKRSKRRDLFALSFITKSKSQLLPDEKKNTFTQLLLLNRRLNE